MARYDIRCRKCDAKSIFLDKRNDLEVDVSELACGSCESDDVVLEAAHKDIQSQILALLEIFETLEDRMENIEKNLDLENEKVRIVH